MQINAMRGAQVRKAFRLWAVDWIVTIWLQRSWESLGNCTEWPHKSFSTGTLSVLLPYYTINVFCQHAPCRKNDLCSNAVTKSAANGSHQLMYSLPFNTYFLKDQARKLDCIKSRQMRSTEQDLVSLQKRGVRLEALVGDKWYRETSMVTCQE